MAIAVPHRSRFSALSRRIILFNGFALVVLIAGVLTVQSRSASLVDERLSGIQQQAQIVAATLAEYTTSEDSHAVDPGQAVPLMRQLLEPTRLRKKFKVVDDDFDAIETLYGVGYRYREA